MSKRTRADSTAKTATTRAAAPTDQAIKYIQLSTSPADTITSPRHQPYHCHLPPHGPLHFASYPLYESHYTTAHTNRCLTCHANFPTPHFLSLHQTEHHDPIVAARLQRAAAASESDDHNHADHKPDVDDGHDDVDALRIYACFDPPCPKRCRTWQKRRAHLIDKHGYPRNFDFKVVETGTDGGSGSLLRRGVDADGHRRSSRERGLRRGMGLEGTGGERDGGERGEGGDDDDDDDEDDDADDYDGEDADVAGTDGEAVASIPRKSSGVRARHDVKPTDTDIDDITKSMSSLNFVPRSVTFGRRKGKAGFAKS